MIRSPTSLKGHANLLLESHEKNGESMEIVFHFLSTCGGLSLKIPHISHVYRSYQKRR
jgi:hypothetical protein